jgi:signal transduction histidine kinase
VRGGDKAAVVSKEGYILVVDDDPNVRKSLVAVLTRAGYSADATGTGQAALQKARSDPPLAVLLDVRLPDTEGIDLIEPLRAIHPGTAVLLITAYASLSIATSALHKGASGFIAKPFAIDEVLTRLSEALEKQRLVTENARLLEEARRELGERERAEQALRESQDSLRRLTAHLESVREEERTRIAREIHDELGQQLTVLNMDLAWLRKRLPADLSALREKAESMSMMTAAAIESVRRISSKLRPGLLDDLGLAAAMQWQAEEFTQRTGIRCDVTVPRHEPVVPRDPATALFRVFQEALTNIARHSGATGARVSLSAFEERLQLTVQDDGAGIDPDRISDPRSLGLAGMRERVRSLGGRLTVERGDGRGTTVTATVPLPRGAPDR